MKKLLLLLVPVLFAAACANDPNDALLKDVMATHDDAMKKMGELRSLDEKLKTYKELLGDDEGTVLLQDSILNAILALRSGSDGMNTWMNEWKDPEAIASAEEMTKYLTAEKTKVDKVKSDIDNAIAMAQQLLKNAPDLTQPSVKSDTLNVKL